MAFRRFLGLWMLFSIFACGQASGAAPPQGPDSQAALYVKVEINNSIKISALKTGDLVEGRLSRGVYSGDSQLFPAGSRIRLTVDKLEKRRRIPNDHWPWVITAFTPRHENYPTFQSASIFLPNGSEVPLRVSLVSIDREKDVRAQAKKHKSSAQSNDTDEDLTIAAANSSAPAKSRQKDAGPIVTLEAFLVNPPRHDEAPSGDLSGPVTLAAGTEARIILLGGVSASRSHPGDSFQARVIEPVQVNSKVVLPEGTLLEGKVVRSQRPRMLSRAGSLLLTFTGVTLPGGAGAPVEASITEAVLDQRSHTRIDPEGDMLGERPGKAWMAINLGVTGGIAKETDDGLQLVIEAIVSTATDASTAGVARIAAAGASGLFILTRHGRDVVIPRFTEMKVMFNRAVPLPAPQLSTLVRP
jgi:hypothetical protein